MKRLYIFFLLFFLLISYNLFAQITPLFNGKKFLIGAYNTKDSVAVDVKKFKKIINQNIFSLIPKAQKTVFNALSFLIHYNIDNIVKENTDTIYTEGNPLFAGVSVKDLGKPFNSDFDDYAPLLAQNDSLLIFTSRRHGSSGDKISWSDNAYYEDIYISYKSKKGWTPPQQLSKNINSQYHDASLAISNDGKNLYIYRDINGGDIYVAKYDSLLKDWSKAVSVAKSINSPYSEKSMSVTETGNTIYFSSDRVGGYGGIDLYMVSKNEKGEWGDPVNLGVNINTTQDEDSPFISSDNRLFFSSKGHNAVGGYDIFYTEFTNGEWTKPKSLGNIINTIDDEVHFVLSKDKKLGYFASTRASGLGGEDIYEVRFFNKKPKHEEHTIELKPELGSKMILNIYFDFDHTDIKPQYYPALENLHLFLREHPSVNIEVSGHTDIIGVFEHNKIISEKRAKAVVDFLLAKGISSTRLSFAGYGADKPVAPNNTESGRAFNRRIECTITQIE